MEDEKCKQEYIIRKYDEQGDFEMAKELEKKCKMIGSSSSNNDGLSIFSSMMGDDPMCRIRLYPLHIMLVAELLRSGELVGIVRGCIKNVETGHERRKQLTLGSILGLRVSPNHRRKGLGLKLVESMEEWINKLGADYTFVASEENNAASTNLFTLKCNYMKLSSLTIFVQPLNQPINNDVPEGIDFDKLPTDEAISLYQTQLKSKDIYPTDIDMILKEKLCIGTWLCYFKQDNVKIDYNNSRIITGDSWVIFSIWNTCEAYKLQVQRSNHHSSNNNHTMKDDNENHKKMECDESIEKPFGFLLLFGLLGEGDRVGVLVKALWRFALKMGDNVKDCKAIMTELGFSDPLREHVLKEVSTISCIDDLWYVKKINNSSNDDDNNDYLDVNGEAGNVFVDPRDF